MLFSILYLILRGLLRLVPAATPADEHDAKEAAAKALELSRQAGGLQEAADLMEEAFNKWPELREAYEDRLRLWRSGIVM